MGDEICEEKESRGSERGRRTNGQEVEKESGNQVNVWRQADTRFINGS